MNIDRVKPLVTLTHLTSLTKIQTEILRLHKDVLQPPPQLQTPPNKRCWSKWFDFHNNHGHIYHWHVQGSHTWSQKVHQGWSIKVVYHLLQRLRTIYRIYQEQEEVQTSITKRDDRTNDNEDHPNGGISSHTTPIQCESTIRTLSLTIVRTTTTNDSSRTT